MNIVYLCIITLFAGLTPSGQAKIDKLLSMASNYQQVEKTIMLLMQPNKVITRIPCISPLQAEDLRHIPVSSAYGQRLHPILNEYKHHSGVDLPGILVDTDENWAYVVEYADIRMKKSRKRFIIINCFMRQIYRKSIY